MSNSKATASFISILKSSHWKWAFFTVFATAETFIALLMMMVALEDAFAGGYAIPAQTAKATNLGNAVTAGIDDPSAVYINPAALSEIKGNEIMGGLNYINNISSVTNSGRRSTNRHTDNFIPTLFGNYHIPGTDITAGVGLYAPFGLVVSYDGDSFTRFSSVQTELKTAYLAPAFAWNPVSYLSVGAGVSFIHSSAVLSQRVFLGGPEASLRIDGHDNAFGYNLGVLVKPVESVKLGLTYRGRVDLNFDDSDVRFIDASVTGGTVTRVRTNAVHVPLPPVISAGINWQINPDWAVEFVYDYTRWSEFQNLSGQFGSPLPALGGLVSIPGFTIPQHWKNTSTLRFGSS